MLKLRPLPFSYARRERQYVSAPAAIKSRPSTVMAPNAEARIAAKSAPPTGAVLGVGMAVAGAVSVVVGTTVVPAEGVSVGPFPLCGVAVTVVPARGVLVRVGVTVVGVRVRVRVGVGVFVPPVITWTQKTSQPMLGWPSNPGAPISLPS